MAHENNESPKYKNEGTMVFKRFGGVKGYWREFQNFPSEVEAQAFVIDMTKRRKVERDYAKRNKES